MRTQAEIDAAATDRVPFSNGTAGEIWMSRWCEECANDSPELVDKGEGCPLLLVALLGKTPKEWPVNPTGGDYTCDEFVQAPEWPGDDEPDVEFARRIETVNIPVLDGQMDLFGDLL